jgi:hypothetical protein
MIGLFLQGLPELNLEGITLRKIDMKADLGMICTDADGISVKGLRLATDSLPVIRIMNSKNIKIEDLDVQNSTDSFQFEIKGKKTENIYIHSVKNPGEKRALIGKEVNKSTVIIL